MSAEFDTYVENAIKWAKEKASLKEYMFKCLAFVEDAYGISNNVEIFGGSCARESADEYEACKNSGIPPAGAFVFYDTYGTIHGEYKNYGHVGLHIGNGEIIHAWDKIRIDNYLDVQKLPTAPGWTSLKLIGWEPVERIFLGYRKK
ncbi:MAG TPA: C40 family peptidase [Clostridiaceae bacterium]|jgi:cell wall-associated NlpC family hydrolase|nr:C40 family peptidase [Clostridiaceae bacterium]